MVGSRTKPESYVACTQVSEERQRESPECLASE